MSIPQFTVSTSTNRPSLRQLVERRSLGAAPYWREEIVDVRDLRIDAYQRILRPHKVRRIVREGWNPLKAGIIVVSRRADGATYVIDGQHRVAALLEIGRPELYEQRVVVWYGLTPEQEAEAFAEPQAAESRTQILPSELHEARLIAKRSAAERVERAVIAAGYRIGNKRPDAPGCRITAVKSVYNVHDIFGEATLAAALHFIAETWGYETPPPGPMIEGVGRFMAMFPDANYPRLSRRVRKLPIKAFMRETEDVRRVVRRVRSSVRDAVAWKLHQEHNAAARTHVLRDFDEALDELDAKIRGNASRLRAGIEREPWEAPNGR